VEQLNEIAPISLPAPVECVVATTTKEVAVATTTVESDYTKLEERLDYCWNSKADSTKAESLASCKEESTFLKDSLKKSEANAKGLLEGRTSCRLDLGNCAKDRDGYKLKCPF